MNIKLLEVNHLNGRTIEERLTSHRIYEAIVKGVRKTNDLDIRCKMCNLLYYIETKYGRSPYKVTWNKGRTSKTPL